MNTPTPRTDDVYLEHRYWANEDEATEAIEDLRDLARKLERELATERARLDWLEKRGPWESWFQHAKEVSILLRAPIREGIDAAMQEGAK